MIITGEHRDEGGMRSVPRKDNTALCFTETASGQYRLRPLYYVSDKDKEWYRDRLSDTRMHTKYMVLQELGVVVVQYHIRLLTTWN